MHGNDARRRLFLFCHVFLGLIVWAALGQVPCFAAARMPQSRSNDAGIRITAWPNGYVELTHGWRVRRGDDPAYARPDFNDSAWKTVTLPGPQALEPGVYWYRMRVQVPPHHGPLAASVFGLQGTYQIQINGAPVPGTRLLPALRDRRTTRVIPLPAVGTSFELAIRLVVPAMTTGAGSLGPILVGTPRAMKSYSHNFRAADILGSSASLPIEVALIFVGLAVLGLFYFQQDHKEYLWLGLYLITIGSSNIAFFGSGSSLLPVSANVLYGDPANYLYTLFQIEFTFAFVHQRASRLWRAYEILLLVSTFGAVVTNMLGLIPLTSYLTYEICATLPATLILPVLLWFWYRKGNREAGLLMIPSILPGLSGIFNNAAFIARNLLHSHLADFLSNRILVGPLGFQMFDLSNLIFVLAIGVVIFLRFTEVSRAEARAVAEMDAAREIQQALVPLEPPAVEGYELAAAYLPAEQVGGDFYQVLPQPDGSALVVLGDVSGKGLKAAMTGTLAIGALRTLAALQMGPGGLLSALNEQMVTSQKEGFITMLCARVSRDGVVTLANAGHLHPYRRGEEIELEAGLPLGIVSGVTYGERRITLEPGEQLTLLSDGIVEARREDGELFGFERTRAGSGASAREMAAAAREFGQEDDITVLTLTREGAGAKETLAVPAVGAPA